MYANRNELKCLRTLEHTQWLSKDKITEIQWNKLKQLLYHAYNNVPYYKRVFNRLNLSPNDINSFSDFTKLPMLDKKIITMYVDSLITSNIEKVELIADSTGGSTGENLHFFYDNKSVEKRTAMMLRGDRWAGLDIGDKYVKLWGSHFDIQSGNILRGKVYNLLFRQVLLNSNNLSDKKMHEYVKIISKYNPKCLIGYASSLYIFAKFLSDNKIDTIKPMSIISSAEIIHEYQRDLIETVFGCKVFNRYGCREFGAIGQECKYHAGLHLNAEHIYVEIINEAGTPCRLGERGELVITDLDNFVFPFIRYRIGDIGIASDKSCECGRGLPLLEKIEGRAFDIIIGINGTLVTGTFWTLLLRTYVKGILQFQIIQEKLSEIKVNLVVNDDFTQDEKHKLLEKIYEKCGQDMNVDLQLVENIPIPKSGKHRFIISKVSPYCKLSK